MTKLEEIIAKYNYDNDSFLSIESMMRDYAEFYAKRCLEIAAEQVKFEYGEFDVEGFTHKEIVGIDYGSILNIKLPEHE